MFQWINLVKGPFGTAKCMRKLTFYVRPGRIATMRKIYVVRDIFIYWEMLSEFLWYFSHSCVWFLYPVEVELWWFIIDVLKGRTYLENSHLCHWWYKRYGSNILTKIRWNYLLYPSVGWRSSKSRTPWMFSLPLSSVELKNRKGGLMKVGMGLLSHEIVFIKNALIVVKIV